VQAQAHDETGGWNADSVGGEAATESPKSGADMPATLETAAGVYRDGPTLTNGGRPDRVRAERFAKAGIADTANLHTELTALLACRDARYCKDDIESLCTEKNPRCASRKASHAIRRGIFGAHIGLSRIRRKSAGHTCRSRYAWTRVKRV